MDLLSTPLYDEDLAKLAFRFAFNLFFLWIVVRWALNRGARDREAAFTAIVLNVVVFFICFTMKKLDLGIGMALGLFAIFGVLRYRTDAIRTKEMTYLFVVIGLAVINALANNRTSLAELVAVNGALVISVVLMERYLNRWEVDEDGGKASKKLKQAKVNVCYDNLHLLSPERRPELLKDLRERIGIEVARLEVVSIDLGTQSAQLAVWLCEAGDGPAA